MSPEVERIRIGVSPAEDLSSLQLSKVHGPTAWAPGDFPTGSDWSYRLSEHDQAEIVALANDNITIDDSKHLKRSVENWSNRLVAGPGFVRVRGFPLDELTLEQARRALIKLGWLLGEPVAQDRMKVKLVTSIRDERLTPGPSVRRFQTNEAQPFHSDAADFVGLLCIRTAKSGGESRLISAHTVLNEMLDRNPDLVREFMTPLPWSRNAESRDGETPYFMLAPLSLRSGVPRLSLIPWFIRQSQLHTDVPRLTSGQLAALELAEAVMADPGLCLEMRFERGDFQLLNNTTVLHGRSTYVDHDDLNLRRHLLRLWVTADPPLSDSVLSG